jgi:hypothetical protein
VYEAAGNLSGLRMNVELAEERILLFADRFTLDHAEGRAWAKRTDAFGAFARVGGLISRPKDEDYEVVYRERRLQPFWRLSACTDYTYERRREHRIKVGSEVQSVIINEHKLPAANREVVVNALEMCREENRREWLFDGLTKQAQSSLKSYLSFDARPVSAEELNEQAKAGSVVVPPQAKSSSLTREVLSQAMPKIEADRILEEKIQIDAIDLCYRPVYAFRYKWQGKEAVVEFDAVTGDVKVGGNTFESYVGKFFDRDFLLDAGVEAANMFIPGANLAKIIVVKGLKLGGKT